MKWAEYSETDQDQSDEDKPKKETQPKTTNYGQNSKRTGDRQDKPDRPRRNNKGNRDDKPNKAELIRSLKRKINDGISRTTADLKKISLHQFIQSP